ncbi:MAG: hypothetical protein F4213_17795 [Boseongicola sp. SB0677_bin_26]|nr:hypothetical protein [Boseongicola sp. SB0665_bin_10]MYG27845.1 hypothetical protein [Boseongicola sp. SB0677_bin_26]
MRIVGDRFLFPSDVLFESGSATLLPEGRASIAEVAGTLEEVADEIPPNPDRVLRVDGHTVDAPVVVVAGAFADNWELGAGRPVNPEDTEAARAQNRRIELKLTERRAQPCRNDHAPRTRRPLALGKPSV